MSTPEPPASTPDVQAQAREEHIRRRTELRESGDLVPPPSNAAGHGRGRGRGRSRGRGRGRGHSRGRGRSTAPGLLDPGPLGMETGEAYSEAQVESIQISPSVPAIHSDPLSSPLTPLSGLFNFMSGTEEAAFAVDWHTRHVGRDSIMEHDTNISESLDVSTNLSDWEFSQAGRYPRFFVDAPVQSTKQRILHGDMSQSVPNLPVSSCPTWRLFTPQ
ncbi:hypothetical protein C2E23DRAFT_285852 [Lenzites betulinus]|nr:hypothetical protein C2E23DRAFT_285852 [Lenzites betulinus]